MTRIAIIPARGGSKRLPRKNIADIGGRPVINRVIVTAWASEMFEHVIVSTEDDEIASIAQAAGAEICERAYELATDYATVDEVCMDVLRRYSSENPEPELFCCLYATAALLLPNDLKTSFNLLEKEPKADVVMGVSSYPIHPYKALRTREDGFLEPQWPEKNALKSQYFPDFVASNGTLYWAKTKAFLHTKGFYPGRLRGYLVPSERAVDLDTPEDLTWARRLVKLHTIDEAQ
jgi:pseudaminic acid cytidylyltransferase